MTLPAARSASRTIPAMQDDRAGRRDLALAAVTIVGLSRLIEPPGVWFVAVFLLGAVILGSLQVLHDETVDAADHALGIPIESLILPAVAAVACLGAIRLVPFGLALVPALMITGFLIERCLALEARILSSPGGLDADFRTTVLVTTLIVAFLAFVGVAATVPGGLAQPGTSGIAGQPLPRRDLLVLATGDAVIAFLLGYRAAALRVTTLRDALWSAATYGDRDRDRGGGAAVRPDPAPDGPGPADAHLLSVGRVPCRRSLTTARRPLDLADGAARGARRRGHRPEPADPRLTRTAPP